MSALKPLKMFDRFWFCLCLWRLVGEFEKCFYMLVFSKCPLCKNTEAQKAAALVSVTT